MDYLLELALQKAQKDPFLKHDDLVAKFHFDEDGRIDGITVGIQEKK